MADFIATIYTLIGLFTIGCLLAALIVCAIIGLGHIMRLILREVGK